jgi:hypothetical protein
MVGTDCQSKSMPRQLKYIEVYMKNIRTMRLPCLRRFLAAV